MKKIIIGAAIAIVGAVTPVVSTFAFDPTLPPCGISVDPTLHYDTISFACEDYTDPNTGIHLNAIYIGVPHP